MKRAIAGIVSLVAATSAWAEGGQLDWTLIPTPAGAAAAWAVKPPAEAGAMPQVVILMRTAQPGAAPGTDVRASKMVAVEADCAGAKVRPAAEISYGADFAQTDSTPVQDVWIPIASIGELGGIVLYYCATPNRQVAWQADLAGAQQKLDAALPRPKPPVVPSETATFEYVGGGDDLQPIDRWLDTASIRRDGNLAKAWVFEVWESGWEGWMSGPPAVWRLYELECAERPRERNIWFQQLNADLTPYNTMDRPDASFSVAGDTNVKAMALRVCNNRPLRFSETIKGDVKTLLSKRYVGASETLGTGVPYVRKPAPQPVDLGPVIRITDKNAYWTYTGTFTREGDSSRYTGKFEAEGLSPNPARLYVEGIRDGMLIIERIGTPRGEYAIPVSNGKVSGKGIAYWERASDDHSWTLDEPATITVK